MEFWSVFVICGLALCVVGSLLYLLSLRASLKEVAWELNDKLNTDTNTLLSISSGNRAMRKWLDSQCGKQSQKRL